MSTERKEDTGVIQADYPFRGKTQKLHYRKTSTGVFIYGSSSAVTITNQIEELILFLINKKVIEPDHTSTGKCLFYRNSVNRWEQVSFKIRSGKPYPEWLTLDNEDCMSDEEMADMIEKTIVTPRKRLPLRRNHASCVVGW